MGAGRSPRGRGRDFRLGPGHGTGGRAASFRPTVPSPLAIGLAFLKLGCTSFGGPVAHLGYLRAEFVARRRWLDDGAYADLVALCQFLPGPSSSQVVFGLGLRRGGLAGACAASLGFTLPSAALMIGLAYGFGAVGDVGGAAWVHGLKLAAVAVVAHAVLQMGARLCTDRLRVLIALVTAALLLAAPGSGGALAQLGALAVAGLVGLWAYRDEAAREAAALAAEPPVRGHRAALGALAACAVLLVALPLAAAASGSREVALSDGFFRAGALIFGGGHVMLPLLHAEVVPQGLVDDATFLAGYGAAQAIPGPLSTFAGYLGASIGLGAGDRAPWLLGALCTVAIFLPSWLLVGGALPFWHSLRRRVAVRAALFGTNAGVVGLLLAALVRPVASTALTGPTDVVVALCALVLLQVLRAPSWSVVAACALASAALG